MSTLYSGYCNNSSHSARNYVLIKSLCTKQTVEYGMTGIYGYKLSQQKGHNILPPPAAEVKTLKKKSGDIRNQRLQLTLSATMLGSYFFLSVMAYL